MTYLVVMLVVALPVVLWLVDAKVLNTRCLACGTKMRRDAKVCPSCDRRSSDTGTGWTQTRR